MDTIKTMNGRVISALVALAVAAVLTAILTVSSLAGGAKTSTRPQSLEWGGCEGHGCIYTAYTAWGPFLVIE